MRHLHNKLRGIQPHRRMPAHVPIRQFHNRLPRIQNLLRRDRFTQSVSRVRYHATKYRPPYPPDARSIRQRPDIGDRFHTLSLTGVYGFTPKWSEGGSERGDPRLSGNLREIGPSVGRFAVECQPFYPFCGRCGSARFQAGRARRMAAVGRGQVRGSLPIGRISTSGARHGPPGQGRGQAIRRRDVCYRWGVDSARGKVYFAWAAL